jgi:hypothetical protein
MAREIATAVEQSRAAREAREAEEAQIAALTPPPVSIPEPAPKPAPAPPPAPPHTIWRDFDGAAVLVQLREPMVACTYPNVPVSDESGPMTSALIRGMCRIPKPDEGRFVELTTRDSLDERFVVRTLVPVDRIAFISKIEYQA